MSFDLSHLPSSSQAAAAAQIARIAGEFQRMWNTGHPPRIEDSIEIFVREAAGMPMQALCVRKLLAELVLLDMESRWRLAASSRRRNERRGETVCEPNSCVPPPTGAGVPEFPWLSDYAACYPLLGSPDRLPAALLRFEHRLRVAIGAAENIEFQPSIETDSEDEYPGTRRFLVERKIGCGGMGVVFQAYDRDRREVVAIKTVPNGNDGSIYHLKREFRSLADLTHRNLVSLYELFFDGGLWFFTMQYVNGVHFLDYVWSGKAFNELQVPSDGGSIGGAMPTSAQQVSTAPSLEDETTPWEGGGGSGGVGRRTGPAELRRITSEAVVRLRHGLVQTVEALTVLHRAGKLHRDIKPSNVLVDGNGRVVLVDFGLAADMERNAEYYASQAQLAGTVSYMSPEQAAGEPLTPASDWYSVGVMLFESLTGTRPFEGTFFEVLRNKQEQCSPSVAQVAHGLPEDLATLCDLLLDRDPEKRPTGEEILRRLGATDAPARLPGTSRGTSSLPFVGREEQLERLRTSWRMVGGGGCALVCVEGVSGAGKTRLVQEFLAPLRESDEVVVLAGRCYEAEAVPFKAFDSLMDALSHYLGSLSPQEVDAILPRDVSALAKVFPTLRRIRAVAEAPCRHSETLALQELRQRAFDALREMLGRLGDRKRLILFIDDLQWSDLDSQTLLKDLLRPLDAPWMMLIVAYRSEWSANGVLPQLEGLADVGRCNELNVCRIQLGPLAYDESISLTRTLLSKRAPVSEEVAEAIATESGGNPCFIDVLIRYYHAEPSAERVVASSRPRLEAAIWACVERLPAVARQLVSLLAVAGHPLRQRVLFHAMDSPEDAHEAMGILRAERLIRTSGEAGEYEVETYHDRIRETVVACLSPADLADRHQRLARALESLRSPDHALLAMHLAGAGDAQEAARHYVLAGSDAAVAFAFDRAAAFYRIARELGIPADVNRRVVDRQLADALANAGRGREAACEYLALAAVDDREESLEMRRLAGMQFLTTGHIEEGLAALKPVLNSAGLQLPRNSWHAASMVLFGRCLSRIQGYRFRERTLQEIPAATFRSMEICWSMIAGLSLVNPLFAAAYQSRYLRLALAAGEPQRIARSLALEASHRAVAGSKIRPYVDRLFERADAVLVRHPDAATTGLILVCKGIAACLQGRWSEAVHLCETGEQILRKNCTGVVWITNSARVMALVALYRMGRFVELNQKGRALLAEARNQGDLFLLNNTMTFMMLDMAASNPEDAAEQMEGSIASWTQDGFHVQHFNYMQGMLSLDLYLDRAETAWRRNSAMWPALESSRLLYVQNVRVTVYETRARCALAMARREKKPDSFLRSAKRDLRRLQREQVPWATAFAELIYAQLLAIRGDRLGSIAAFEKAIRALEAVEMHAYAAAARRRLGEMLPGSAGEELTARADAEMASQCVRDPRRAALMYVPWTPAASG